MIKKLLLLSGCILVFASCSTTTPQNHTSSTLVAQTADSKTGTEGKCSGDKSCSACKNCKYCKHCSKDGGTCGVCK
ncbi:hypothetical protein F0919_04265 [Taibaiella lutea]|uniref:Metallothionein n=1 Tax=Taibaiella lutea TaxID=2608001 RepID=A0A5M6CP18_9BACT|nr:hypothetical protein [Taibaiella lutea]KAA5536894.1 hypothetical protein F0919_04265 [Taibaiella lutea]